MALVTCQKIGQSLAQWLKLANDQQLEEFAEALSGIEGIGSVIEAGTGIKIEGNGSEDNPYVISVQSEGTEIEDLAGNQLGSLI